MVRGAGREEENCSTGFSRSDSCKASEDSTTSIGTELEVRAAEEPFMFVPDCGEMVTAASKHRRGTARKTVFTDAYSCPVIEDSPAREEVGPQRDSAGLHIASAPFAS